MEKFKKHPDSLSYKQTECEFRTKYFYNMFNLINLI